MEQRGLLISAVEIPAREKDGVPKPACMILNVCYGNSLEDSPEMIYLTPPDPHRHVLQFKKYSPVVVTGRLQRGRFYTDAIRQGQAA